MKRIDSVKYEITRMWPLLLIIALALFVFGDAAQFAVQLYNLSMVALVIVSVHFIRKALFPYLDMSTLVLLAKTTALGAALVFMSVIALLVSIIIVTVVR